MKKRIFACCIVTMLTMSVMCGCGKSKESSSDSSVVETTIPMDETYNEEDAYVAYYQAATEIDDDEAKNIADILQKRALRYASGSTVTYSDGKFKVVIPNSDNAQDICSRIITKGTLEIKDQNNNLLMQASEVKNASVISTDETNINVYVEFDKDDITKFDNLTMQYLNQVINICFKDNVISSPTIFLEINDGKVIISNISSLELAQDLVCVLNTGSIDVELGKVE